MNKCKPKMTSRSSLKVNNSVITESLKDAFGSIPSFIEENIGHLSLNGNDFICKPCGQTINVVYCDVNISVQQSPSSSLRKDVKTVNQEATTDNFKEHLLGEYHKNKNSPNECLVYDSLKKIYGYVRPYKGIPQIIVINMPFMSVMLSENRHFTLNKYFCNLCEGKNSIVVHSEDLPKTEDGLIRHFVSDSHKDKCKEFNLKQKEIKENLEQIYGCIPFFILDNVKCISENNGKYTCTLCNEQLCNVLSGKGKPRDVDRMVEMLKRHFQSADHKKAADLKRAFEKIPCLTKHYSSQLPFYVIKNIEYIEFDCYYHFLCSLCQVSICDTNYNHYIDPHFIDNSFRIHMFSSKHTGNLLIGRDFKNNVYQRLVKLFETFPGDVINALQFFGRKEDNFYCHLCKCEVEDKNDSHYTEKNIMSHIVSRYENVFSDSIHSEQFELEKKRCAGLLKELQEELNLIAMPVIISRNIQSLSLIDSDKFVKCNICDVKRPFYPEDSQKTKKSLEQHLNSKHHAENMETELQVIEVLQQELTAIPQFILQNIKHISYGDTSEMKENAMYIPYGMYDDMSSDEEYVADTNKRIEKERVAGENFYCNCCRKVIVRGKQKKYAANEEEKAKVTAQLTEYNLRDHLFSKSHKSKVNNFICETDKGKTKLESLFGKIPDYLYANINYIEKKVFGFECTLCNCYLSINLMEKHFNGHIKSGFSHHDKLKSLDQDIMKAQEELTMRFWTIPELIVKNLDLLSITGENFFCELCQETIFVNEYDLELSESEFLNHLSSTKHQLSMHFDDDCDSLYEAVKKQK